MNTIKLDADHICKLLKIGITPVRKPKFTIPTWPIDPLHPFKGTDSDTPDFWQMYAVRKNEHGIEVDVPCIAEVDYSEPDYLEIASCFDLFGNEIVLSREEKEKELAAWKEWMEECAKERQ